MKNHVKFFRRDLEVRLRVAEANRQAMCQLFVQQDSNEYDEKLHYWTHIAGTLDGLIEFTEQNVPQDWK